MFDKSLFCVWKRKTFPSSSVQTQTITEQECQIIHPIIISHKQRYC